VAQVDDGLGGIDVKWPSTSLTFFSWEWAYVGLHLVKSGGCRRQ
jgi:hypothetical protein